MKKIIGAIISILILLFIGILILRIWDIQVLSLDNLIRSGATLIIMGIAIIILVIIYGGFFKNNKDAYENESVGKAHPKR